MTRKTTVSETTKATLKDAFWELYQKKSIEQISIREITDRAGYNRGTFYLYFKDVYDILEQIEQALIAKIYETPLMKYSGIPCNLNTLISGIIQIYQEYFSKLKVLLGPHGDPGFTIKLQNIIKKELSRTLIIPETFSKEVVDYYIEFVTAGILAVVMKWISEENGFSLEEFIRTMVHMLAPLSLLEFVE